jgi:hypothetical protein
MPNPRAIDEGLLIIDDLPQGTGLVIVAAPSLRIINHQSSIISQKPFLLRPGPAFLIKDCPPPNEPLHRGV